jgi:hypothetical protein
MRLDRNYVRRVVSKITSDVAKEHMEFFIAAYNREVYYDRGRPKKWKSLSEPYATRKKNKYGNRTILKATGVMSRSFVVRKVNWNKYKIVNTSAHSSYHQNGTTKMVARPIVYQLPKQKKKEISDMIAREIFYKIINKI